MADPNEKQPTLSPNPEVAPVTPPGRPAAAPRASTTGTTPEADTSEVEGGEPEKSDRFKRRQERLAKVRAQAEVQRVRVKPRDDEMRGAIKHPTAGGFRSEGSIEWPYDTFTKRRIRDGAVVLEDESETEAREQSRARSREG